MKVKYPINIEAWVQEFKSRYPDNENGALLILTVTTMANEAYEQGLKDAESHHMAKPEVSA